MLAAHTTDLAHREAHTTGSINDHLEVCACKQIDAFDLIPFKTDTASLYLLILELDDQSSLVGDISNRLAGPTHDKHEQHH
jgi:hypothetical protein